MRLLMYTFIYIYVRHHEKAIRVYSAILFTAFAMWRLYGYASSTRVCTCVGRKRRRQRAFAEVLLFKFCFDHERQVLQFFFFFFSEVYSIFLLKFFFIIAIIVLDEIKFIWKKFFFSLSLFFRTFAFRDKNYGDSSSTFLSFFFIISCSFPYVCMYQV